MTRACALLLALLLGCSEEAGPDAPAAASAGGIVKETGGGPIKATVTVSPEEPALGDPITVTLEVQAEPGITVEMPSFGEALGRFTIVDFVPREERRPDGGTLATQTYRLQAPMSGRQRIPPLRIEYVDHRPAPSRPADTPPAPSPREDQARGDSPPVPPPPQGEGRGGGAATASPADPASSPERTESQSRSAALTVHELLTDEIPLVIRSVVPATGVADELRPPLGALTPPRERGWLATYGLLALAPLGAAAGFFAWRAARMRARRYARHNAYDLAMQRLAELERRGLPSGVEVDAWYVELSGIVRRYLEDRYAVRAPELTTEEFLHEARRAAGLSEAHRQLLADFLAGCDRVKFAGYTPDDAESMEAITAARRFLDETRPRAEEAGRAAAAAA